MENFGQKPGTILTCKSGTFMCYSYGQRVWKFHGERSGDKMSGEEEFTRPSMVVKDSTIAAKQRLGLVDLDTRKLGRSTSIGSSSSSESECSSQPSPISETMEDVTNGFLSPMDPDDEDASAVESLETSEQEMTMLPCLPPSPVETKNKVDIKALSNLINSLLKKHSLVQSGLELLKKRPALALRLQQRRTRKVLADQGIIPPLKSPAAYYEQLQKLERARTGDFLNKKMQDRPERDQLIQKHILEDTSAYDSLVAHQKELKKAQLADDLNEKIFFRPGVFELVEKNIIPADDTVTEALKGGHVLYKKTGDFIDEDSSDAFSPEMPTSHDQGVSYSSPSPLCTFASSPPVPMVSSLSSSAWAGQASMAGPVSRQDNTMVTSSSTNKMPRLVSSTHTTVGHPYLMHQSSYTKSPKISSSVLSQKNLRKKKEKPKFKKLKYHQYIPPDQQGKLAEQSMPDSDTPYSRLLEQQQLYLQLQIMNRQYPSLMANQKSSNSNQRQEVNNNFASPPVPSPPPLANIPKQEKKKRTFTVRQLEEMKVAELKEELKARKEKVTGTKEVLVERLKRFAIPSSKPVTANQPLSENITGLINATIQSTIRANTEQALAAAVNNNGAAGSLLLKARTMSPPVTQPKQENQQANMANLTSSTANMSNSTVPGQRVLAPAPDLQFKVDTTATSLDFTERQKDHLLHKQQQQIEDLRRMVELHRTQLHHIQEKERTNKQEVSNNNNSTSSTNIMLRLEQPEQVTMNVVEQPMNRQHISQVLQKHVQNRLSSKEQPSLINGINQQMPHVKQEISSQMEENVFHFASNTMPPNVSLVPLQSGDSSSTIQEDAPIILSIKPPLERSLSESTEPPKYDQAIQMLNEEKRRLSHQSIGSQENMVASPAMASDLTNADMDDLLELLEIRGEIPVTPTRQKAFPQAAVIEGRIPQHATMHYHHFNTSAQVQMRPTGGIAHRRSMDHLHRTISADELDNMAQHPQRHSLELPALIPLADVLSGFQRKDPNMQRRYSGDILDSNIQRKHSGNLLSYDQNHTGLTPLLPENQNDFTSLLVRSAGDILMDSSHVPPSHVHHTLPNCLSPEAVALHQEPILSGGCFLSQDDPSKGNAYLNLGDPYAAQPFSPMDTGTSDGQPHNGMMEERVGDPHLSSSSIHDSHHSLDKCLEAVSLPQSTGSYLRRYEQPLAGASPQRHPHSHLIKSSSQELLSGHVSGLDHSMQVDELGWLDLTLSSPYHAPPSPMNLHQHHRTSMHSSMGSILEQETGGNLYNLSGEGLGTSHNEFDLIDSLDLNSIANTDIDGWDGL